MININKPLFEYSEIELKSIDFDDLQVIKRCEKNLDLINIELERKRLSTVYTDKNIISVVPHTPPDAK